MMLKQMGNVFAVVKQCKVVSDELMRFGSEVVVQ